MIMQSSQFNFTMQKGLDIINRYIYYSKELLQSPFTYSLENKWEKEFYCHYYNSVADALLYEREIPKSVCKKASQANIFMSILKSTPHSSLFAVWGDTSNASLLPH